MTITIPEWVLWALGIPAGVAVAALAALGVGLLVMIARWDS